MNKRLFTIFILGFSSGLPLALISSTLQAWFASVGMSVLATGSLSLLGLPYLYCTLWTPLLDRFFIASLGKRRSWILAMQLLLLLGFNLLSWFSPTSSPQLMAFIALMLAFFSATQGCAIDAHRIEYLPLNKHGLGASLFVVGYNVALLIGGGGSLLIAQYVGWDIAYRSMGSLMLLGVFTTLLSQEPMSSTTAAHSLLDAFILPMKELAARPKIIFLLLFILLFKLGEAFTTNTSGIVMPFFIQGLGFSLATIAYINKILGVAAILIGGLTAGILLLRWPLYKALLCFGLLQALTNALFIVLALHGKSVILLAISVVSDNFAAGMGTTALVTLIMRVVDKRFTATQFSLLVSIAAMPRVFSGPFAAYVQGLWGWVGVYELSFILALLFIPFLLLIRSQIMKTAALSAEDKHCLS